MRAKVPFGRELKIIKVKDFYTAGETSSYWGNIEQRKSVQQEKYAQFMINIGQMTKSLFQLLRELRIMDERLEYYDQSFKDDLDADYALKNIWITMVEGGAKNPDSVYGLAAQVGFLTLPDLFFKIRIKGRDNLENKIKEQKEDLGKAGYNRKVLEVLGRKLFQYYTWREKTYKELNDGKRFKLRYFAQHLLIIKQYLNWLRPYLKNIKRLQMNLNNVSDPDIIAAFETSKIEVEILGIGQQYDRPILGSDMVETKKYKEKFPVIKIELNYVAIPQMSFQQEYQKGAIHVGRTEIILSSYIATQKEIDEYMTKQDEDDLELLRVVDSSIEAFMDDIRKYVKELKEKDPTFKIDLTKLGFPEEKV